MTDMLRPLRVSWPEDPPTNPAVVDAATIGDIAPIEDAAASCWAPSLAEKLPRAVGLPCPPTLWWDRGW